MSNSLDPRTHTQSPRITADPGQGLCAILFRYGVYSLMFFGMIFTILKLAAIHGGELFSEGSVLEHIQFLLLVAGIVVALWAAFRPLGYRILPLMFASLCGLAAIREFDSFFDRQIPFAGWQLPFILLLLGSTVTAWKSRAAFMDQLRVFARHRSFGTLWGGFMVAIPYAQLIGHGPLMEDLFGENYERSIKRLIEESAETLGYVMILIGIFDFGLTLESQSKAAHLEKDS